LQVKFKLASALNDHNDVTSPPTDEISHAIAAPQAMREVMTSARGVVTFAAMMGGVTAAAATGLRTSSTASEETRPKSSTRVRVTLDGGAAGVRQRRRVGVRRSAEVVAAPKRHLHSEEGRGVVRMKRGVEARASTEGGSIAMRVGLSSQAIDPTEEEKTPSIVSTRRVVEARGRGGKAQSSVNPKVPETTCALRDTT
jgi:hypothetical protein